jgi:hypothetical protein
MGSGQLHWIGATVTDTMPSGTSGGGHNHAAPGNGHGLTKKVGPLPVWGWAVVIVGAYLLYHYLHNRSSSAASTVIPDSGANPSNALVGGDSGTSTTSTGSTGTATAADWIFNAQQYLLALGYDQSSIDTAFQDWTSGNPLTSTDVGILDSAVNGNGAPPAGLPVITLGTSGSTATAGTTAASTGGAGVSSPTEATPPALPSVLPAGTNIIGDVVSIFADGAGWTYVTNKGYVYNTGGSNYYGGTNGGEIGGIPGSNIVNAEPITSGPDTGGYVLYNAAGQTYKFGPTQNAATGQYAAAAA